MTGIRHVYKLIIKCSDCKCKFVHFSAWKKSVRKYCGRCLELRQLKRARVRYKAGRGKDGVSNKS